jgi:hypothetical protein
MLIINQQKACGSETFSWYSIYKQGRAEASLYLLVLNSAHQGSSNTGTR